MRPMVTGILGGVWLGLAFSSAGKAEPADIGPGLLVMLAVACFMAGGVWFRRFLMGRTRQLAKRRRARAEV